MPHVFISYSHHDQELARKLYVDLEANGIDAWADFYDIPPGADWSESVGEALDTAIALILIVSPSSLQSRHVKAEWTYIQSRNEPVLPIIIQDISSEIPFELVRVQFIDFRQSYAAGFAKLLGALRSKWSPESSEPPPEEPHFQRSETLPEPAAKGYAFLSYMSEDADFIDNLKSFLKARGYAFWDYRESERDYGLELYLELESRIAGAAIFISVLSDGWRKTLWPAREYVYAEEANIPVFVVQAKQLQHPIPMLLNLRTRIDRSKNFEAGIRILDAELNKKGL